MKQLLLIFFALAMLAIGNAAEAASQYPLQSKYPNVMLYKAETNHKIIALTFDDCPDDRFTPQILNVLKKHHVKATFFLLGTRVHKHPEIAKKIYQEGHVIGNHTYWHPELTKTSVYNMVWEIQKNEKEIEDAIGIKTKLFRAPYGAIHEDHVKKLGEMGYRGIGWSIDTEDWQNLPSEKIIDNIISHLHPGAIVLMHSAGHWTQDLTGTVEALDEMIPYLRQKGYRFVTIPEMLPSDPLK